MSGENGATDGTGPPTDGDPHRVASADDLEPGDRVVVTVEGREIAVFNVGGEYHALLNFCIHQGGPLCEGDTSGVLTENPDRGLRYVREGEVVVCPWHAWQFDIATGEHLARPGDHRIPTYDVVVRDGDVYVLL